MDLDVYKAISQANVKGPMVSGKSMAFLQATAEGRLTQDPFDF
jgi:hypothetical protein